MERKGGGHNRYENNQNMLCACTKNKINLTILCDQYEPMKNLSKLYIFVAYTWHFKMCIDCEMAKLI